MCIWPLVAVCTVTQSGEGREGGRGGGRDVRIMHAYVYLRSLSINKIYSRLPSIDASKRLPKKLFSVKGKPM